MYPSWLEFVSWLQTSDSELFKCRSGALGDGVRSVAQLIMNFEQSSGRAWRRLQSSDGGVPLDCALARPGVWGAIVMIVVQMRRADQRQQCFERRINAFHQMGVTDIE